MSRKKIAHEDGFQGTLLLISPEHALDRQPERRNLVPAVENCPDILLERTAARMLKQTLSEVGAGGRIAAVSGYRPHQEQVDIWENTLQKEGETFTRTYVAKPGHSEHESGLAIDLAEQRESIDFICPAFPRTGICQRFRRAAPFRGFVERYPAGKERVTGIGAEPWHFRYVGYPHSVIMTRDGMVLEEYLQFLKSETSPDRPCCYEEDGVRVHICYLPLDEWEGRELPWPDTFPALLSGTNEGGLVWTCWGGRYA